MRVDWRRLIVFSLQSLSAVHFFLYAAVGIVSCFVIGWVASFIIPASEKEIDGLTIYSIRRRSERREARKAEKGVLVADR